MDQTRDTSPHGSVSQASIIDSPFFHSPAKKSGGLPQWLDHFNFKDFKTLFKCSAAVWIYTLLIFINPTLNVLGQATFFGALVLVIAPPSGVVFMGLLAGFTLIFGVCLAWAWGTITMKAALATRPAADLQRRYAQLQSMASQNTSNVEQASGQAEYTQIAIFNGFMLDSRVSVTYFCMIGLFVYLIARLRVKTPKLTLTVIFALVISDIYLTTAPLIPQFQGTIPQTLIKPAAVAIGIGFISNILFFPQSTSYLVLDGMHGLLSPMNEFLRASSRSLHYPTEHLDLTTLKQTRLRTIEAYKAVAGNLGFLSLDVSVGRLSAEDVQTLAEPLRRVLVMFLGLVNAQIGRQEHTIRDTRLLALASASKEQPLSMKYEKVEEESRIHDVSASGPLGETSRIGLDCLASSCGPLLAASENAIQALCESLYEMNQRRWYNRPSATECKKSHESHVAVLDKLRNEASSVADRTAANLWVRLEELSKMAEQSVEKATQTSPLIAGGLLLVLVFEEKILNMAATLQSLLGQIVLLESKRTTTRLWLPTSVTKLFKWAVQSEEFPADSDSESVSSATMSEKTLLINKGTDRENKKVKDEKSVKIKKTTAEMMTDRLSGGRQRNRAGQAVLKVAHWFSNTEGLYALRVLVVTIALGVVAVIPSTAGFYYREKGLWGLIMAQTALQPYTADFVFGFISRIIGTILGAVMGLVAWYIGAGRGPGNPYGMAAVMAPVIVVFMWLRLFLPPSAMQGSIMAVATCYLVVAYSWDDTHIPSYGNPGVGYEVFWRRMLLVMIGFAAASIITFFPRPPTASRHHRKVLSRSLGVVRNQYTLLISNCRHETCDLESIAEQTGIQLGKTLLELEPQIPLLRFEFSSSSLDAKTLEVVCKLTLKLNETMTQLLILVPRLPADLKARFVHVTGMTNERLVADVLTMLTLAQHTLNNGGALPGVLPLVSPERAAAAQSRNETAQKDGEIIKLKFSQEMLAEEGTRKYCSAMAAFLQFSDSIDQLLDIMRKAVGSTGFVYQQSSLA